MSGADTLPDNFASQFELTEPVGMPCDAVTRTSP